MKRILFLTLLFALPIFATPQEDAVNAAEKFVTLLDEGKYRESWQSGSLTLRLTFPENRWAMLMNTMRGPLGREQNRSVAQVTAATNPKNLPKGDYMIVLFVTDFSKAPKAKELLTLVQTEDGSWKVVTYLVSR